MELKVTVPNEQYREILLAERSQIRKRRIRGLILVVIVIASFQQVGFLDAERLGEGLPALATLAGEMFPPDFSNIRNWGGPLIDTLFMSVAGTALAVIISLPLSIMAANNTSPNRLTYLITRTILNVLRAVPELIMGIIFVAAVGFGLLPGVLALGLHSAGMVGKFFAESIEHVAEEPVEAARSTGAHSILVIFHSVIPQAYSQMVDVCIYRWEYNFRASTVMGMVGAGGIGFELMSSLRILQYNEVFALLLVILSMVTAIDWIGSRLRLSLK